ncbi:hypothetical protein ACFV2H_51330 [Streptomyces sp. NPDC059629]|uniref:hypothetical protein n=1 Tax=Streptomyces sp. NPDC059629 TaxID=3346889 RepID=UPI0036830A88
MSPAHRGPAARVRGDCPRQGGGPFRWARAVRSALAGLLRRDAEFASKAAFGRGDLGEVRV